MKNFYKKTEAMLVKRRKYTKAEEVAYLNRIIKRANKAAGYVKEKKPTKWIWSQGRDRDKSFYFVEGNSRSEIKGKIKKELGISKKKPLPKDIVIIKASEIDK